MTWQPIATAPKDGSSVLLWDGERVSYGGWIDAEAQGVDECEAHLVSDGWWSVDLRENEPTHWMPLPDPPVIDPEPPDADGEAHRGSEAAAYEREQQAEIQRVLK